MPHQFDPGYFSEPFRSLCVNYPQTDVYLQSNFAQSGGDFHRGRSMVPLAFSW